jgi:hypothetical protein
MRSSRLFRISDILKLVEPGSAICDHELVIKPRFCYLKKKETFHFTEREISRSVKMKHPPFISEVVICLC